MWIKVPKNLFIWAFMTHEVYVFYHSDSSAYSRTDKKAHGLKALLEILDFTIVICN